MNVWLRMAAGVVCLLALAACVREVIVGQPAPDFEATDIRGRTIRLSDLRGKVILLNFWGIWCRPCRDEVPELVALHERLAGRPFEIIAFDVGDEPGELASYARDHGMRFPVVADDGYRSLYGIYTYPTNVVVDAQGQIRFIHKGYTPEAMRELTRNVEKLLATTKAD